MLFSAPFDKRHHAAPALGTKKSRPVVEAAFAIGFVRQGRGCPPQRAFGMRAQNTHMFLSYRTTLHPSLL